MKKNLIFIFLIMICLLFSFTLKNENLLEINGEKFYFSIDGHINWEYYKTEQIAYSKILKSFYIQSIQEILNYNNMFSPIQIDLPDSLSNGFFDIQKGFYFVKIDSIKHIPEVINGFKTTTSDATGRSRVIASIPDSSDNNWRELFIFSKNYSSLNQITPYNPINFVDDTRKAMIKKTIANYFVNNHDVLKKQLTYQYPIDNNLNDAQLIDEISSRFDLTSIIINDNYYVVEGISTEYQHYKFLAIIFLNEKKVVMKIHTKYFQSFKISDDNYIFCQKYQPGTGANDFLVYRLKENEVELVFIDGSYSM